jgi:hypothetical protein
MKWLTELAKALAPVVVPILVKQAVIVIEDALEKLEDQPADDAQAQTGPVETSSGQQSGLRSFRPHRRH